MKFLIWHGWVYAGGTPPKGAKQFDYVRTEKRTADDPAKVPFYGGTTDWWYGEGSNHRVENGLITRDVPCAFWAKEIEIASLEEMAALAADCDVLIYHREEAPDWLFIETAHECD